MPAQLQMSCQDSSAFISGQWVDILLRMDNYFIWLFHEAGIMLVAAVTAHASQDQSSLTLDQLALAAHAVGCMEVSRTSVRTGLFSAANVRRRWQHFLCSPLNTLHSDHLITYSDHHDGAVVLAPDAVLRYCVSCQSWSSSGGLQQSCHSGCSMPLAAIQCSETVVQYPPRCMPGPI